MSWAATFLSTQVDVQGRDHLPAQGLPPPHDHVDGPLPVEERLEGLLLVLVDEVHIVDPQQPVIDPTEYSPLSAMQALGPESRSTVPIRGAECQKAGPSRMTKRLSSQVVEPGCPGSSPGSTTYQMSDLTPWGFSVSICKMG